MSFEKLAEDVIATGKAMGIKLATAESCTGGMIGAALTDIAGSSAVYERGFITYSNEAKQELLGVDAAVIDRVGAVSPEVAEAMAVGALERSEADCAVSVTGIAGPDGGSLEKPVGLVYIATATSKGAQVAKCLFSDSHQATTRQEVREATVETALSMVLDRLAVA
ncbi:MAG: CinA family protein [Pseudomonadota bacterium]